MADKIFCIIIFIRDMQWELMKDLSFKPHFELSSVCEPTLSTRHIAGLFIAQCLKCADFLILGYMV